MAPEQPPRPSADTDNHVIVEELLVLSQHEGSGVIDAAPVETALDLKAHPNTYVERAWNYVKPWLIPDQVGNVNTKSAGPERVSALHEQRKQIFQLVDRIRGGSIKRWIGGRQAEQFQVTIKEQNFILQRQLGEGGFGTTFEAANDHGGIDIVKFVPGIDRSQLDNDDGGRATTLARKAITEVASLKKLNGLHAPRLEAAQFAPNPGNPDERMLMIAMEKVAGESGLDWLLNHPAAENVDELLVRVHSLLQAVHDIHAAGVLHMDLKPNHVYFSESGRDVTFIDYGLAALPELEAKQKKGTLPTSPHYAESTNQTFGTEGYSAPEREASVKYDAFSVGRIIQAFLYRESYEIVEERMEKFRQLPTELQELSRIAERLTTTMPIDRYDIQRALDHFESFYLQFARPDAAKAISA